MKHFQKQLCHIFGIRELEKVNEKFLPLENYSDANGTMGYAPQGFMIDDISALQWMYGVNEQFQYMTDNVYNAANLTKVDGDIIYQTIWDAGGNDTIDWSGQVTSCKIDLVDGHYSFFGSITSISDSDLHDHDLSLVSGDGILGMAYNAMIENAIGGKSEDDIKGNSLDNELYGGIGANVIDFLTGGAGSDTFVINANTDKSSIESHSGSGSTPSKEHYNYTF